ncbi:adenylosuccinate lyase-like protein [Biscogniauxia sp. FL1348]|nr:adenylosuccinate lyase-like protein [Biscogniauxia sp. FL1348]
MAGYDTYKTPLDSRYSSPEMKQLFSARNRHSTWRKLWLYLAEGEKELGIDLISDEALEQMRAHLTVTDDDFRIAAAEEKRRRHDVMAHVHAFGQVAPAAAGIIHYGATSCYVTDNAELILMRDAIDILLPKLAKVIHNLATFADKYKDVPTLGFTHMQPAQLITVGKRAAAWAQNLAMDLEDIEYVRQNLRFRGAQGTTGTQASFLEIFKGDGSKGDQLNKILCDKAGFPSCYDISTQTYTRKVDLRVANAICGLGATVQQITSDIRHLANLKEVEEPFEKDQIGSSAMAYKRNPMRSERIASLGRKLSNLPVDFKDTFSVQWMERTLDDSHCSAHGVAFEDELQGHELIATKIDIPEMFLLADAVLSEEEVTIGMDNVTDGLVIYPKRIAARVHEELPFMATENIIMRITAKGGNRQTAHEEIRVISHQASDVVKHQGGQNDLIDRIKTTEYFKPVWDEIDEMLDPSLYIGRSVEIVDRFCGKGGVLEKKLQPYQSYIQEATTTQLNL